MAARVAAKVKEIVAEKMQSAEMQQIVEKRLREERARLEQKVCPQTLHLSDFSIHMNMHTVYQHDAGYTHLSGLTAFVQPTGQQCKPLLGLSLRIIPALGHSPRASVTGGEHHQEYRCS